MKYYNFLRKWGEVADVPLDNFIVMIDEATRLRCS